MAHDLDVDPTQSALVRATEPGTFFRRPLGMALRTLGVLGALATLGPVPLLVQASEGGAGRQTLALVFLTLGVATGAFQAAPILFARARRLEEAPPVRFPVVPAMREALRACAEAAFVWCMALAFAGWVAFLIAVPELDLNVFGTSLAAALGVAALGWLGLLGAHVGTEGASALVQIANNTHRGERRHV